MLICDNASFHKAKWLTEWVATQKEWLRLEFLPAYSPDFNPIERLWRWIKSEHLHNRCWKSLAHLKTYLIEVLEKIKQKPAELTGVMRQEIQRLNTVFEFYQTPSPFSISCLMEKTFLENYMVAIRLSKCELKEHITCTVQNYSAHRFSLLFLRFCTRNQPQ